jgi:hypothetical protein
LSTEVKPNTAASPIRVVTPTPGVGVGNPSGGAKNVLEKRLDQPTGSHVRFVDYLDDGFERAHRHWRAVFDRSHFAAPAAFARDWRKIDWFCEDGW